MTVYLPGFPLVDLGLIVDPDADTRALYRMVLAPVVAEFDEADDGAEALAKVMRRRPGLLVTEARLPRIDGYTLCSLLRNEAPTHDIPIVVVTGSALPSELVRAKQSGADDVIAKPCTPEELREHARSLLLQSRQLRDRARRSLADVPGQLRRSTAAISRAREVQQRIMSRTYERETTSAPPLAPPELRCPRCDQPLVYEHSNVGGVSPRFPEQWDYFACHTCGRFQYRHRTRKLRAV